MYLKSSNTYCYDEVSRKKQYINKQCSDEIWFSYINDSDNLDVITRTIELRNDLFPKFINNYNPTIFCSHPSHEGDAYCTHHEYMIDECLCERSDELYSIGGIIIDVMPSNLFWLWYPGTMVIRFPIRDIMASANYMNVRAQVRVCYKHWIVLLILKGQIWKWSSINPNQMLLSGVNISGSSEGRLEYFDKWKYTRQPNKIWAPKGISMLSKDVNIPVYGIYMALLTWPIARCNFCHKTKYCEMTRKYGWAMTCYNCMEKKPIVRSNAIYPKHHVYMALSNDIILNAWDKCIRDITYPCGNFNITYYHNEYSSNGNAYMLNDNDMGKYIMPGLVVKVKQWQNEESIKLIQDRSSNFRKLLDKIFGADGGISNTYYGQQCMVLMLKQIVMERGWKFTMNMFDLWVEVFKDDMELLNLI